MCGIIGYIGNKSSAPIIIEGLKKLEYRGYDSAGLAVIHDSKISILKYKGKVSELKERLGKQTLLGSVGIGHTRWATHGKPSQSNSHPHSNCSGKIVVVHNGIIENFIELKAELLKQGCKFKSETDTEVIVHLIGKYYSKDLGIVPAVRKALKELKGSYALGVLCIDEPEKIVAVRQDSPLIIGVGKKENFIVSDVSGILEHTKRVIYLDDGQIAVVRKDDIEISDITGNKVINKIDKVTHKAEHVTKGKFAHFMLKEIYEQPQILSKIISLYTKSKSTIDFSNCSLNKEFLLKVQNVIIVACGTSYHVGMVAKYALESFIRIPVSVDLGSEFRYRDPVISDNTLVISISQSGETADTLAAVREVKKRGVKVLSICNVLGSSLVRESDYVIPIQAGPEISVASTKAFTAQMIVLYLLGIYWGGIRGVLSKNYVKNAIEILRSIPEKQKEIFNDEKNIKFIAKRHLHFGAFLYLGRNINYPIALEGALKLKEISYIPTEGYASGEMKHGPIALIDEYRAVVCIANDSFIFDKMISNIQEILARKAKIIIIATKGKVQLKDYTKEIVFIPEIEETFSPLLTIIPLQLLAYHIAVLKGYDVDKPRNLAKSVTVE
ncbi:MAG: glutamine--fructose-6-phosphate transaminase (isomerizing) [Candidatus Omnitrophica bacterium]|nr:glutamine--fructose-6-phosphate transaminase (isomerizing) [Candidatus Omnitrophota bacterium]